MEGPTLLLRLARLRRRCQRALGLYNKMGRSPIGDGTRYSDMQVQEWRRVNTALLDELTICLEEHNQKRVIGAAFAIRDRFHNEWRQAEAEMNSMQKELIRYAETADFVKASVVSRNLVSSKARTQAARGAYNEIQQVLSRNRGGALADAGREEVGIEPLAGFSNVIPLVRQN